MPPPRPATGRLVYIDREGAIVVLDLENERSRRFALPDAFATEMALAPSREQLAYVAMPRTKGAARIALLDLATGAERTVDPERADFVGDLSWGGGGALLYRTYKHVENGVNNQFALAAGATSPRYLTRELWPRAAEHAATIAYAECMDKPQWGCASRLVLDAVAGGAKRVLAENGRFEPYAFTPDGRFLLTLNSAGEAWQLTRYPLDGGAPLELGPVLVDVDPRPLVWFGTWVSPDSREALVRRSDGIVAVKIDGSAERTIARGEIFTAGFVSDRGVLYVERKNLAPGNDVPQHVDALWYVEGDRRVQLADFGQCAPPIASRSGRLAARTCEDGLHMYSLITGKELRAIPRMGDVLWPTLLGFDGGDGGVVTAYGPDSMLGGADHVLRWHGIDGRDRELGTSFTHVVGEHGGTWPAFVFEPGD